MTSSLAESVQSATGDRVFAFRFCHSMASIYRKKGCAIGTATTCSLVIAKIYALSIAFFCMEGSVRALMDVAREDEDQIVRLRPLGDASGWTALTLFTVMAIGAFLFKVVREGEYCDLKKICESWIKKNQELLERKPHLKKRLYSQINDILDAYSSQCLFSKWVVSRKITALKIQEAESLCEKRRIDERLNKIFYKIKNELCLQSSYKKILPRIYEGQKSHLARNFRQLTSSWIIGIALPIIFITLALASYTGSVGLGKQLFHDREELTDTGHFGEWLFNAIEMVGVALFFHIVSMINEGDFARTRSVYAVHLQKLRSKNKIDSYNRLCDIANAELEQLANNRLFFQLPGCYRFKKYEKEMCAI